MPKKVWLFGTRHDYHGLAPNWVPEHVAAFVRRSAEIINVVRPHSIGEESSEETVASFTKNAYGGTSALGQWCYSNQCPYLAFDPTDEECTRLRIPDSLSLRIAEAEGNLSTMKRIHDQRLQGRELEWMRRINQSDATSWLIVIGADHIATMRERFIADGWAVEISEANWMPDDVVQI